MSWEGAGKYCCPGKSSGNKKPGLWPGFRGGPSLLLVSSERLENFSAGFVSVAPAFNFYPLALLEILVVLEEVLDLLQQQGRQVGVFLDVHVQLAQLVVRNGEQLGVA